MALHFYLTDEAQTHVLSTTHMDAPIAGGHFQVTLALRDQRLEHHYYIDSVQDPPVVDEPTKNDKLVFVTLQKVYQNGDQIWPAVRSVHDEPGITTDAAE